MEMGVLIHTERGDWVKVKKDRLGMIEEISAA